MEKPIRKEELKVYPRNLILQIKDAKDPASKLIQVTNTFIKIAGYKIHKNQ